MKKNEHYPFEEPYDRRPNGFEYAVLRVDSWQSRSNAVVIPIQPAGVGSGCGVDESFMLKDEHLMDVFLGGVREVRDVVLTATHREGESSSYVVKLYRTAEFEGPDECNACVKDVLERLEALEGIEQGPEDD